MYLVVLDILHFYYRALRRVRYLYESAIGMREHRICLCTPQGCVAPHRWRVDATVNRDPGLTYLSNLPLTSPNPTPKAFLFLLHVHILIAPVSALTNG